MITQQEARFLLIGVWSELLVGITVVSIPPVVECEIMVQCVCSSGYSYEHCISHAVAGVLPHLLPLLLGMI
jgi:hypothetical protein